MLSLDPGLAKTEFFNRDGAAGGGGGGGGSGGDCGRPARSFKSPDSDDHQSKAAEYPNQALMLQSLLLLR